MGALLKLLDANIEKDVTYRERKKLRLINLNILTALGINGSLFLFFVLSADYLLLSMDVILILLTSGLPFLLMRMRKYTLSKMYVALIYPPLLFAINVVYGDLSMMLYFSAVGIMSVYLFEIKLNRIISVSYVAFWYGLYLLCFKSTYHIEPLVNFEPFVDYTRWWINITGFMLNVVFVWSALRDTVKHEVKLSNENSDLKSINEDKTKFLSIVSHDLRGPFNSILGMLSILVEEYEDFSKEEVKKMLEESYKSADSAFQLLIDLLMWSQSMLGRIEFKPESVSAKELIVKASSKLESSANSKGVDLVMSVPNDSQVKADSAMIQLVLRNLISNAIKYSKTGGVVEVMAVEHGDDLEFIVKDNGVGISGDGLNSILHNDDFHSTTGTNNEAGTGFGLHLCKEFIERHQSKLQVVSQVGVGSTFSFSLPLIAQEELVV